MADVPAGSDRYGVLLFVALLVGALAGALFIHFRFDVALGLALMLIFVGWPLGGTLITLDDDLPGGWSNPDGTVRPPWLEAPFWGEIFAGLAISAMGFAVDVGWNSRTGARCWMLAFAGAAVATGLFTRRWWLCGGVVVAALAAAWL